METKRVSATPELGNEFEVWLKVSAFNVKDSHIDIIRDSAYNRTIKNNFAKYLIIFLILQEIQIPISFFLDFFNFLDFHPQLPLFPVLSAVLRQIRWFQRHIFGI